jgi:hypothetical protein
MMAFEAVAPIYDRRLLQEERTGDHRSPLQQESEAVYREIVERGPRKLADLMQALLAFLGRNDMMAYLVMMAIRRRGLNPSVNRRRGENLLTGRGLGRQLRAQPPIASPLRDRL